MKTSQVLMEALDIIDVPGQWTQGEFARNSDGVATNPCREFATCFCSAGVLYKVKDDATGVRAHAYLSETARECLDDFQRGLVKAEYKNPIVIIKNPIVIINDEADTQFCQEMSQMWMGAIFNALADGN